MPTRSAYRSLSGSLFADSRRLRWLIPALVGLVIFGNHFTRDTFGALEKQLESTMDLTSQEYALSNALYFFPNMITPLIAGVAAKRVGASNMFLWSTAAAAVGHVLVALAVQSRRKWLLLLGRAIGGTFYEVIDCLPITFVAPFFTAEWASVTGALNGFLRLGSIANFMLCPVAFAAAGLSGAFWLACAVGASGVLFAVAIRRVEARLDPDDFAVKGNNSSNSSSSGNSGTTSASSGDEEAGDVEMMAAVSLKLVASDVKLDDADYDDGDYNSDDDGWVARPRKQKQQQQLSAKSPPRRGNSGSGSGNSNSNSSSTSGDGLGDSDLALLNRRGAATSTGVAPITSSSTSISSGTTTNAERWLPDLSKYSRTYYLYLLAGAMLYGAMVPFWFIGSKYMQDYYDMSVGRADALMLLPEGLIVVISSPLGYYIDKHKMPLTTQLRMLTVSCFALGVGYIMLLFGAPREGGTTTSTPTIPPLLSMVVLGGSYGVSNSVFWSCITDVINDNAELGPATGLVACAMNIFPSVLPLMVAALARSLGLADYDPTSSNSSSTSNSSSSSTSDILGLVLSSESALHLVVLSGCAVVASLFAAASASAAATERGGGSSISASSGSTSSRSYSGSGSGSGEEGGGSGNVDSSSHGLLADHRTSSSSSSTSTSTISSPTTSTSTMGGDDAGLVPKVVRGRFSPGSSRPTVAHTSDTPAALRHGHSSSSGGSGGEFRTIELSPSPTTPYSMNPPTTTTPVVPTATAAVAAAVTAAVTATALEDVVSSAAVTASWLRERVVAVGQQAVVQAREGINAAAASYNQTSSSSSTGGSSSGYNISGGGGVSSNSGGDSSAARTQYFRDAY